MQNVRYFKEIFVTPFLIIFITLCLFLIFYKDNFVANNVKRTNIPSKQKPRESQQRHSLIETLPSNITIYIPLYTLITVDRFSYCSGEENIVSA